MTNGSASAISISAERPGDPKGSRGEVGDRKCTEQSGYGAERVRSRQYRDTGDQGALQGRYSGGPGGPGGQAGRGRA